MLTTSHARLLLKRVATHILAADSGSQMTIFNGSYHKYEKYKKQRLGKEGAKPKRIQYKPTSR